MPRSYSDFLLGIVWLSALLIVSMPFLVAADYGGVLRWTQLIAAAGICGATTLALASLHWQSSNSDKRRHLLLLPLAVWVGYAWLQTLALPEWLVAFWSPATADAYLQWAGPLLPAVVPNRFPATVSLSDTTHAAAWMTMMLPLAAASALIFHTRGRLILMLGGVATGGAILALVGLVRSAVPDAAIFSFMATEDGAPFGTFVNRNNAALMLNLGMAASLGLLSWRLMALTGQQVDDAEFEFNDLLALVSERESAIGMAGTVLCGTGLLVSGSRAGLAAAVVGILIAFGWMRRRRGLVSVPVITLALLIACTILILPLNLQLESLQRLQTPDGRSRTILNDGRFQHWPEALDAAVAYLPGGSGLATYAYAYLPFQDSGPGAWFRHADNMWLQWFVELGMVGLIVPLVILWMIIRALRQLSSSPDALDAGIRTAGWYAIGAILFSQCFDSGLMIPANMMLVTIAGSAIISRSVSVMMSAPDAQPRTDRVTPKRLASPRRPNWAAVAIPVTCLLAGIVVMSPLTGSANAESLLYTADSILERATTDAEQLDPVASQLEQAFKDTRSADLAIKLAEVRYRQARLREVEQAQPRSELEAKELFAATGRNLRRLLYRDDASTGFISNDLVRQLRSRIDRDASPYADAFAAYQQAVACRPLDPEAREGLLYLDFVNPDRNQTEQLLGQLAQLYHNSNAWQMRLATFAIESGHQQTATELFQKAIRRDVNLTDDVVRLTELHERLPVAEVIPSQPIASRIAASTILRSDKRHSWRLLPVFLDRLQCDQCLSLDERASCYTLAGDVAFATGSFDLAFEHYLKALSVAPSDAGLRLKVIRRLRETGRYEAAMEQARLGHQQLPADIRFKELLDALSASRTRDLESSFVQPLP